MTAAAAAAAAPTAAATTAAPTADTRQHSQQAVISSINQAMVAWLFVLAYGIQR